MSEDKLKRNKAIIILSFDDGREDQFYTANYLQEQAIPAVFNITTGYLDGKCSNLTEIPPMNKESIRRIAAFPGIEMAAHGNMHGNSVSDIAYGRERLLKLLELDKESEINEKGAQGRMLSVFTGFASPGSQMTPNFIKKHEIQLRCLGFSYVRTGSFIRTYKLFRRFCRKVVRFVPIPFLFTAANEESLNDKGEKFCFTSIPIMADTTLREVESLIDLAVRRDKICVLMFHSILNKGEKGYKELWTWDRDRFKCLVQYLKVRQEKGDLSVMNIKQLLEP